MLEDAGLNYCCRDGNSLHEACLHANASSEEILNRLREAAKSTGGKYLEWKRTPLYDLIRPTQEKHHGCMRQAIPSTLALADRVTTEHRANRPELLEIGKLFAEVGREMIVHMQKEEEILFPYVEMLECAANAYDSVELPFFQSVKNSIQTMMKEHDATGDSVTTIRSQASEYKAPAAACTGFKALYQAFREFKADLHQHVHLENNFLFPRAVELEARFT